MSPLEVTSEMKMIGWVAALQLYGFYSASPVFFSQIKILAPL